MQTSLSQNDKVKKSSYIQYKYTKYFKENLDMLSLKPISDKLFQIEYEISFLNSFKLKLFTHCIFCLGFSDEGLI